MSTMPQVITECAFNSKIFDTTPSWTNISTCADGSNRLRQATIGRGRQYELDDFETGTCDAVLKNIDGYIDPANTGSPYAPHVLPHKQFRIRAVYNSTSYTLFTGYVERWPPVRFGGRYIAQEEVTAFDAFGLFDKYRFPRKDDGYGGGSGRLLLGVLDHRGNTFTQKTSFHGNDEGIRAYALVDATYETGSSTPAWSDHMTFEMTYTNGSGVGNRLAHLEVKFPHLSRHPSHHWTEHITINLQGNDTIHSVQKIKWKSGKFTGKTLRIRVYGERPIIPRGTGDAQLKSILKNCGWPSSKVNVRHAGRFNLMASSPWRRTLLEEIRRIQDSEAGQIYVDRTGTVQFEDRDWRYHNWGSPHTWHDGAGTGSYTFTDAEPSLDDEQIVNQWEITRITAQPGDNPKEQNAADPDSQENYGVMVDQRLVTQQTDEDTKKLARYLLARTKKPLYRFPSLTIRPLRNPTVLFPAVLGMEISDSIIINQYPPNSSNSSFLIRSLMNIDHITHTITPDDWVTELTLSPRVTTAFPGS